MRRLLLSVLIIAAGLCPAATLSGCCLFQSPDRVLADGIDSATKEVFAEYEKYVIEGKPRPAFNDNDKEIRRGSLRKVKELLDQARD